MHLPPDSGALSGVAIYGFLAMQSGHAKDKVMRGGTDARVPADQFCGDCDTERIQAIWLSLA